MRRFLRDAAVALFVGAVLVALVMVIQEAPDAPSNADPTPAQEAYASRRRPTRHRMPTRRRQEAPER